MPAAVVSGGGSSGAGPVPEIAPGAPPRSSLSAGAGSPAWRGAQATARRKIGRELHAHAHRPAAWGPAACRSKILPTTVQLAVHLQQRHVVGDGRLGTRRARAWRPRRCRSRPPSRLCRFTASGLGGLGARSAMAPSQSGMVRCASSPSRTEYITRNRMKGPVRGRGVAVADAVEVVALDVLADELLVVIGPGPALRRAGRRGREAG